MKSMIPVSYGSKVAQPHYKVVLKNGKEKRKGKAKYKTEVISLIKRCYESGALMGP